MNKGQSERYSLTAHVSSAQQGHTDAAMLMHRQCRMLSYRPGQTCRSWHRLQQPGLPDTLDLLLLQKHDPSTHEGTTAYQVLRVQRCLVHLFH